MYEYVESIHSFSFGAIGATEETHELLWGGKEGAITFAFRLNSHVFLRPAGNSDGPGNRVL